MTGAAGRSQTEVVVEGIKTMIATGALQAGSRLPVEKDLAERLGVSRGSLREGVRALALLGVLETKQGDGTYVTALDPATLLAPLAVLIDLQHPRNIVDIMAVRRVLEVEAAGRAALRISDAELAQADEVLATVEATLHGDAVDHAAVMEADVDFHRVIARASGNPTLGAMIEGLASRTVQARTWRAMEDEGAEERTHAEHRAILGALAAGDPDAARLRMAVHLIAVEQYWSTRPDADVSPAQTPVAEHGPLDGEGPGGRGAVLGRDRRVERRREAPGRARTGSGPAGQPSGALAQWTPSATQAAP